MYASRFASCAFLVLAACVVESPTERPSAPPLTVSVGGTPAQTLTVVSSPISPHSRVRTLASADAVIDLAGLGAPIDRFYPMREEAHAISGALVVGVRSSETNLRVESSSLRMALVSVGGSPVDFGPPSPTACPDWLGESCVDAVLLSDREGNVDATWSLLEGAVTHSYLLGAVQASNVRLRFATDAEVEPIGDGILLVAADGEVWHQSTIVAWDVTGARVTAEVGACDGDLCVELVGDPSAVPWTVDPTLTPPDVELYGTTENFGAWLSSGRDVDGDGYGDLIVSQFRSASLFYGSADGIDPMVVGAVVEPPNGGYPVGCALGDVNGDSFVDVVLSSWEDWASVYHSRSGGLRGSDELADSDIFPVETSVGFGVAAAAADFDGDGFDDIALADTTAVALYGTIDVWPGTPNGIDTAVRFPRPSHVDPRDRYWAHRISTGDVNGDGRADLLVAGGGRLVTRYSSGQPNPALYLGTSSGLGALPVWTAGSLFGSNGTEPWNSVIAPDLDGDGFDDLLFAGAHHIWWLRGTATGVEPAAPRLVGTWQGSCVSADDCPWRRLDVAGTGDVNGDGFGDIAITYDGDASGSSPVGLVAVVAGGPEGPMAAPMWILDSQATIPTWSVAHATGDLNGDGLAEVAAAYPAARLPWMTSGFENGSVALWHGRQEPDIDVDGTPEPDDCHPYHPAAHPGATEVPGNLLDDDCDGTLLCYLDLDLDGTAGTTTAAFPAGTVCADVGAFHTADDCHDTDPQLGPHAAELPHDDIDQDCDGYVACTADLDGDGFGGPSPQLLLAAGCSTAPETTTDTSDCDDADPDTFPGAPEVIADGIDQDCDGLFTCWVDDDLDGYGDGLHWFSSPSATCPGGTTLAGDCDDTDPLFHPAIIETVNNLLDEDCDGLLSCWADTDLDGWGGAVVQVDAATCELAAVPTAGQPGDCNDSRNTVYPGAVELPGNGRDENCDGFELCYLDLDDDTWGDAHQPPVLVPTTPHIGCGTHAQRSHVGTDCDDSDPLVSPGQDEVPANDVDEDCDGQLGCYADRDGDGFAGNRTTLVSLPALCPAFGLSVTDCDDLDANTSPGAPDVPGNTDDEDCDGALTCYVDADGDGYGSSATTTTWLAECDRPLNQLSTTGDDCDDGSAARNPSAREFRQDGTDQDCDGVDGFALWVSPLAPEPGGPIEFDVRGADPGATLWLVRSSQGPGQGPCPAQLGGACVGVRSPQLLLSRAAGLNGALLVSRTLPETLPPGTQVWFQVLASRAGGPALRSAVVPVVVGP
jgi:hypothetical protein